MLPNRFQAEDDDEAIGSLECDKCLVNSSFVPPANWGAMMSNDKTTQALFEKRLNTMRKKFITEGKDPIEDIERITNDMMISLGGDQYKIQSQVSDRLQKIQDNHPEFISLLSFLVEPLQDSRTKLGMKYPEFPTLFDDDAVEDIARGVHHQVRRCTTRGPPARCPASAARRRCPPSPRAVVAWS